jgi:hypothetical protein
MLLPDHNCGERDENQSSFRSLAREEHLLKATRAAFALFIEETLPKRAAPRPNHDNDRK